jgi:acid phosphatase type 7
MKQTLISLFILFLYSPNSALFAQLVVRGPYLQQSTPQSIIIRWGTDVPTTSKVWYGTTPNNLNLTATANSSTQNHSLKITGLNPATKYYYRIGNNTVQYPELSSGQYFKTHPSSSGSNGTIRAWMLGNAGTGDPEQLEVRDAYYSVIGEEHLDMILFTGDNAYENGTDSEYQQLVFDVYKARMAKSVSWSCFGNHDGGDANSNSQSGTYYNIFDFPKNAEAGGLPTGTEAYYSFDYGNMHVISLNTHDVDRSPDGDMVQWLAADLAATDRKWKVVLLHHRPYTGANNNSSDSEPTPQDVRAHMLPIMEAAGVDLVLSSHSHSYQRSFLINGHYGTSSTFNPATMGIDMGDGQADGDGVYDKTNSDIGTVYVVAGTAGQEDHDWDELNHPVMAVNSGSPGSVQLLVSDVALLFQFINEDAEVEDYFTIVKPASGNSGGFSITNPLSGNTFPVPYNMTITTALSEESMPLVQQVSFYVNDNLIGVDQAFPYYQPWSIPLSGAYQIKAVAKNAAGTILFESEVTISAGLQETCIPIAIGSDDAEEKLSGQVSVTSNDLELVHDGSLQKVGLRFTNVGIPQGTTISEAYLQFTTDEIVNVNPCALAIHGEKNPNPSPFANTIFNISNRAKTNAVVNWSPATWNILGESAAAQRSPNIAALLTEITNQAGYNSNNAIAFILSGSGKRVAYSFEGGAAKAPKLCISYMPAPCSDADNDGICDVNDPCPTGPEFGFACNDNIPTTYNDKIDDNCNCVGTPGFCPNLQLIAGSPCNDNNPATYNDLVTLNCNCVGTPFDCPALLANIGTACNDGDPNTSNDMLAPNCNCVGSLFDCLTMELNIGDPCDDGSLLTINDVVTTSCDCAGTLLPEIMISVAVNKSSDDAEQRAIGSVSISNSDLELVNDSDNQVVGVRFLGTGIPAGAIITNAYIQFTVDETASLNPCTMTITGQASNNAATFVNTTQNISLRPRTNAAVNWQPALWTAVGAEGIDQRTSDLSTIVQEIVNRPGYTEAVPFVFIFEGEGKRVAESYDGLPNKAPKLVVSYVYYCEDDDNDGVCNQQDLCVGSEPGTPCNDNNNATTNDVITANCNCAGTSFDCPTYLANIGASCDDGNPTTTNDVLDANCNCAGLPPGASQTICTQVLSGADDSEERVLDGRVRIGSGDLELIEDNGPQLVGIRFANLSIPQGAVIESATIQFTVEDIENVNPCQLAIFAQATDHAAAFAESNFNISSRPRTNASATWSPASWTSVGASGADQKTVNLSAVLQEVVSRPGYTAGNAVAFIMDGFGKRVAEAFEGGVEVAPKLCVTYSTSVPPTEGMMAPPGKDITIAARVVEGAAAEVKKEVGYNAFSQSLKLYPNPSKGDLHLSFYNEKLTETQVLIQNVNGQLLRSEVFEVHMGDNVVSMLNLDLANGVYVLRVWDGDGWLDLKLVICQ